MFVYWKIMKRQACLLYFSDAAFLIRNGKLSYGFAKSNILYFNMKKKEIERKEKRLKEIEDKTAKR